MYSTQSAVEMTGTIDQYRQLRLDSDLPIVGPKRVRVIVLYSLDDEEITEAEWLTAAARNPTFKFLNDQEEDIYSLTDGKPFHDEV
jgi:hypothetical protein